MSIHFYVIMNALITFIEMEGEKNLLHIHLKQFKAYY